MNFALCLHILLVIGKYTDVFGDFLVWRGGESKGVRVRISS